MKLAVLFFLLLCSSLLTAQPLWMRYTNISPNGDYILFSYQADLYKVKAEGGLAIPLTQNEGRDFMPIWSPDGEKIAFASDRYGNYDVFIMNKDGGELKRLTHHSSSDRPYSFSADGKSVLFSSTRMDNAQSVYFPYRGLPEAYSVSIEGGEPVQITSVPMEEMNVNQKTGKWLYQDKKGYENEFRKHHTSSVTRDIWLFDPEKDAYSQIINRPGEDRDPVWNDGKSFFYLSEESGSFNVWKYSIPSQTSEQITFFENHPVRNLSMSINEKLCFNYDGEIYVLNRGGKPKKLSISIETGNRNTSYALLEKRSGVSEFDVSPNEEEICFVLRGDVFVASLESGITKRITNTPYQERSASFSPDGRSIVYAAEKNGHWGIYNSFIKHKEEEFFFNATVLNEKAIVVDTNENFLPKYSPDGKRIAFLSERTVVKVFDLATEKSTTILPKEMNYSYSDGDQYFDWSTDGRYLLVNFLMPNSWISQVGLISTDGKGDVLNLTESGYGASGGTWMMGGEAMIFYSGRNGMKNHASWGFQGDVYGLFFTQDAYDRFELSEMELKLLKEKNSKKEKNEDKDSGDEEVKEIMIDFEGLSDRKKRLTIHSSSLGGAVLTNDGEQLYYLSKFEKGYDLWVHNFYKNETKIAKKLNAGSAGNLKLSKDGNKLFYISNGAPHVMTLKGGKDQKIAFKADFELKPAQEREYIFNHAWKQVEEKFYKKDLHGVDWEFYKSEYEKFLPHINNNYDFSEMLSELLGELNASHTGCSYRPRRKNSDQTASLGIIYDLNSGEKGLRVDGIINKSPADYSGKIKVGDVLISINDVQLSDENTLSKLMNRISGQSTRFTFKGKDGKYDITLKPITQRELNNLVYERWVKDREEEVDSLSNGRLGYVHVRGMNDASFRTVYDKVLGKYTNREGLVVDTRFNGGGWLHDDLATFLNGEKYFELSPRGQSLGVEPMFKWYKPSVVLMGEGNYSDAHMFPETYKALGIGKLVGMPVPGTATAVWWETQIDPTLVFGIPQVGVKINDGSYLENKQLEPDVKVALTPQKAIKGKDEQLEKAVNVLLK